jgi:peptide chain release factor subunit 1
VAQLTEDTVRSLARFRANDAPVTTCYLDLDGRVLPTHKDVQRAFDALVRQAHARFNGDTAHPSVVADLDRMTRHVKGYGRSQARALAMFSCTSAGLWEVHELPVRVTNQLVVHASPYVRQLEEIVDEYERFGVLLADRQRARMFLYEMGELVERTEMVEEIERRGEDNRGELYKTRQDRQLAEQVHQHLRHAAQLAFVVQQKFGFDRLLVGGPNEVQSELIAALHPYVRACVAEEALSVPTGASLAEVRRAAHEVELRLERKKEAALVDRLRQAVASGGRGAAGLPAVLAALNERRVGLFLVSRGYVAEGWRCPSCGALFSMGRRCGVCGAEMTLLDDVVEEAVHEALTQQVRVDVCVGNADLDVLGRIGALLRF